MKKRRRTREGSEGDDVGGKAENEGKGGIGGEAGEEEVDSRGIGRKGKRREETTEEGEEEPKKKMEKKKVANIMSRRNRGTMRRGYRRAREIRKRNSRRKRKRV